jgi:hypothetical protein
MLPRWSHMPDIRLSRPLEIAFTAACAVLVAFGMFLILMTFSAAATPVANWALGVWGPEGASVGRAQTRMSSLDTLEFSDLDAPGTARLARGRVQVNLLGFLPRVPWIARAEMERGYFDIRQSAAGEGGGPSLQGWRRLIDEVDVADIEIRYTRRGTERKIAVREAYGSLRSGAVRVSASGGDTGLAFEGDADASTLSDLSGRLRLSGDNFADFAWLAGFAAPDTPPYDAVADISLAGGRWDFEFTPETRIGDSDISGPLVLAFGEGPPVIDARLRSANLDFDDLGIVFGVPIGVGSGETVSDEQARARRLLDESDRLIPNAVIDFTRLDAVDGKVTLEADKVSDAILDIQGLRLEFEIEGRVVRAPVLQLDFAQGRLAAYVTLDGTRSPAVTTAEGNLANVPLSNLALDPYVRGTAAGEFKLEARGDGFREAAASLTGKLSVWSEDADLLAIVAEGAALDLGELLLVLNERAGEETYTMGRCAVASIDFTDGTGRLNPALIDTDDSLVLVEGEADLAQETLNLSVRSEAKDASFGTLVGDVGIGGTFRSPQVSALNPESALQIGLAAILGSVSGGLAALPFIEIGDAPDAPCADILARAREVRR